jgi:hypothetical protein
MITFRLATLADAATLADMRWDFRSEQRPPTEPREVFVTRCAAWMRRELQAGSQWTAWVAVDGDVIVGQVWLQMVQKIPNPVDEREQIAYLSNLYIVPSARGGTGSRLLDLVLDACRANGVDRVVLWPSARSVTLYRGRGFSNQAGVMELKIG